MPPIEIIAGTAEPLHIDDVKAHVAESTTDRDSEILRKIAAVRAIVETHAKERMVTRTMKWLFYEFPACGVLSFPTQDTPLRKVDHVKYIDTSGVLQTWSPGDYKVSLSKGLMSPAYGKTWPFTRGELDAVEIQFVSGYATPFTADAGTDVLTASPSHVFANADALEVSNSGGALPAGLSGLTTYYARDVSGAMLKLAASSGGAAIDLTGPGIGKHFLGKIPEDLIQAMLLLIGHWYEHKETVSDFQNFEVPLSAMYIVNRYIKEP